MTALGLVALIVVLLVLRQNVILIVATAVAYVHTFMARSKPEFLMQDIWFTVDREVLLTIPMFLLAGMLMTRGSIARRIIRVMVALTSWIPGGLGVATVLAMTAFSAISASSVVTLLAIGSIMHPALLQAGYSRAYATGLLCCGGTLGIIVPPSLLMIVYGITVDVSITDLFKAGWGPGLVLTGLLCVYTFWLHRKRATQAFDLRELGSALGHGMTALLMPVILLGGVYSGYFTVTESAAVSVAYALIVETLVHRELGWRDFVSVTAETTKLLGTLLLLLAAAGSLNTILDYEGVPKAVVAAMTQHVQGGWTLLLLVNLALLAAGALMDEVSAIVILVPLLAPLGQAFGFDPIHFAVITIVNLQIGYVAPPVAINLFVAMAAFKESFGQVTRAALPFIGLMLVTLAIVAAFPALTLAFVR